MLAIKFYSTMPSDDENVLKGISGKIPAIVIDLERFSDETTDESFIQMSSDNYEKYLQSIQPELNQWMMIQTSS